MTRREFLSLFEEILEASPGSLTSDDVLPGREGWDSLAVVSLIAMVDEQFGAATTEREIAELVANQEVEAIQLPEQTVERVAFLRLFQERDQSAGCISPATPSRTPSTISRRAPTK